MYGDCDDWFFVSNSRYRVSKFHGSGHTTHTTHRYVVAARQERGNRAWHTSSTRVMRTSRLAMRTSEHLNTSTNRCHICGLLLATLHGVRPPIPFITAAKQSHAHTRVHVYRTDLSPCPRSHCLSVRTSCREDLSQPRRQVPELAHSAPQCLRRRCDKAASASHCSQPERMLSAPLRAYIGRRFSNTATKCF